MRSWRDIKAKAKAGVHSTFALPAVYLTHLAGTAVACTVRVHRKPIAVPVSDGVEMVDMADRVVFNRNEVPEILVKAYVFLTPTEVYLTGPSRPERDGYVHVEVTPVTGPQLSQLIHQIYYADTPWNPAFSLAFGIGTLPPAWNGVLP